MDILSDLQQALEAEGITSLENIEQEGMTEISTHYLPRVNGGGVMHSPAEDPNYSFFLINDDGSGTFVRS
jgi:hypothetical protein